MSTYTTIRLKQKTKDRFDKQKKLPRGIMSADEFLNDLLDQNEKKK